MKAWMVTATHNDDRWIDSIWVRAAAAEDRKEQMSKMTSALRTVLSVQIFPVEIADATLIKPGEKA